jgi:hypothetical protein
LITARLKISVRGICDYRHPNSELLRLRGFGLVTCGFCSTGERPKPWELCGLEIVINSVKNRQANRFASQVRIGAFHSRFDDQFHAIASSAGNVGQDIRPFPWTHQRDIDSSHGLDRSPPIPALLRALRKAQADEALGRH